MKSFAERFPVFIASEKMPSPINRGVKATSNPRPQLVTDATHFVWISLLVWVAFQCRFFWVSFRVFFFVSSFIYKSYNQAEWLNWVFSLTSIATDRYIRSGTSDTDPIPSHPIWCCRCYFWVELFSLSARNVRDKQIPSTRLSAD